MALGIEKPNTGSELSKLDAAKRIQGIYSQLMVEGFNDYETSAIKDILKDLENGKLDPKEALAKVMKIRGVKQSYH